MKKRIIVSGVRVDKIYGIRLHTFEHIYIHFLPLNHEQPNNKRIIKI
jgi:hypothetical protein